MLLDPRYPDKRAFACSTAIQLCPPLAAQHWLLISSADIVCACSQVICKAYIHLRRKYPAIFYFHLGATSRLYTDFIKCLEQIASSLPTDPVVIVTLSALSPKSTVLPQLYLQSIRIGSSGPVRVFGINTALLMKVASRLLGTCQSFSEPLWSLQLFFTRVLVSLLFVPGVTVTSGCTQ